jgi:hypothetical protein
MNLLISFISLIYFLNFSSAFLDLSENASCPSHVSVQKGICVEASRCEAFKTDRNKLGICSFNGRIPIVCCPENSRPKIVDIHIKRISAISKLKFVFQKNY